MTAEMSWLIHCDLLLCLNKSSVATDGVQVAHSLFKSVLKHRERNAVAVFDTEGERNQFLAYIKYLQHEAKVLAMEGV